MEVANSLFYIKLLNHLKWINLHIFICSSCNRSLIRWLMCCNYFKLERLWDAWCSGYLVAGRTLIKPSLIPSLIDSFKSFIFTSKSLEMHTDILKLDCSWTFSLLFTNLGSMVLPKTSHPSYGWACDLSWLCTFSTISKIIYQFFSCRWKNSRGNRRSFMNCNWSMPTSSCLGQVIIMAMLESIPAKTIVLFTSNGLDH